MKPCDAPYVRLRISTPDRNVDTQLAERQARLGMRQAMCLPLQAPD